MGRKRQSPGQELDDKLQAYDGKDYTEIIEFPVELVDRDGVVRRYSYEESLAVYHRRIQSAPWRYGDDDLIRAEIGHCTRRIDQIKRSYSERPHISGSDDVPDPRSALGQGYDVLRGFYDRALVSRRLRVRGEFPLRVSLLEHDPACRVYHVSVGGRRGGQLLYVYPFDRLGDGDPRGAFDDAHAAYRNQGLSGGRDIERLLFAQDIETAGFILTGTDDLPDGFDAFVTPIESGEGESIDGDGSWDDGQPWWMRFGESEGSHVSHTSPFEDGVEALRSDRSDEAVLAFRRAVELNPYHREAYLALLAVLDEGGMYEEADLYGEMAGRHLPNDGLIRYRQGINLVRQGRLARAVAAFDEASALAPSLYQPAYFAAHVLIARGDDLEGARSRLKSALRADDGEPHVMQSLRGVERCLLLRKGLRGVSAVLAVVSVIGLVALPTLAVVGLIMAGILALGAGPVVATWARWTLQRRGLASVDRDDEADEQD